LSVLNRRSDEADIARVGRSIKFAGAIGRLPIAGFFTLGLLGFKPQFFVGGMQ
jgi:hypothetical protein